MLALSFPCYFGRALDNPRETVREACRLLDGVYFDTFVATGLSGATVAPMVAARMRKNVLIIRKPDDNNHHSGSMKIVGSLGTSFIFIDDCIDTGRTRRRLLRSLQEAVKRSSPMTFDEITYVGDYLYNGTAVPGEGRFLYYGKTGPWHKLQLSAAG